MNPPPTVRIPFEQIPPEVTELPGNSRQTYADFRVLEHSLFSNDLSGAREAYFRIQGDLPSISVALSRSPFPSDSPRLRAFRELGDCLATGDLEGARVASTKFQY